MLLIRRQKKREKSSLGDAQACFKHDTSLICINQKNSDYSSRIWYNLCRTGSVTNLDDLNIVRPIKSDKMGHVTVIVLSFGKKI